MLTDKVSKNQTQAVCISHDQNDQKSQAPTPDPLILAYMWLLNSVQLNHDAASIQAKALKSNASAQQQLIGDVAKISFNDFTPKQLYNIIKVDNKTIKERKLVDYKVLEALEESNQEISAIRGVMEDQLIVLRQGSQVSQSNLNSSVDESQQTVQQGAGLMQMLVQLTNQIARI